MVLVLYTQKLTEIASCVRVIKRELKRKGKILHACWTLGFKNSQLVKHNPVKEGERCRGREFQTLLDDLTRTVFEACRSTVLLDIQFTTVTDTLVYLLVGLNETNVQQRGKNK